MYLIVGLGNPGDIYRQTLHNAGFIAIDTIANYYGITWSFKAKFNAEVGTGLIQGTKATLGKPLTFMNLSGRSVDLLLSYYKVKLNNLIIIHDDIDLKFNEVKYKISGGNGGHNGLKSLDNILGNNYARIRLGVGRPQTSNIDIANYVLSKFSKSDYLAMQDKCYIIAQNIDLLLQAEIEKFKSKIK